MGPHRGPETVQVRACDVRVDQGVGVQHPSQLAAAGGSSQASRAEHWSYEAATMTWVIYWIAQAMVIGGCLYVGSVYGATKERRGQARAASVADQHLEPIGVPTWHPEADEPR